jgi:hypothetical protein
VPQVALKGQPTVMSCTLIDAADWLQQRFVCLIPEVSRQFAAGATFG